MGGASGTQYVWTGTLPSLQAFHAAVQAPRLCAPFSGPEAPAGEIGFAAFLLGRPLPAMVQVELVHGILNDSTACHRGDKLRINIFNPRIQYKCAAATM